MRRNRKKARRPIPWPGWVRHTAQWLDERPLVFCLALAIILTLAIEILARRSFGEAFVFLGTNPLMFCVNVLIIFAMLCISLVIPRKRYFVITVVSVIWLTLGIVEFVITDFRVTPLTYADLAVIGDVTDIFTVYLKPWELILIGVCIVLVITALVFLFRYLPNRQPRWVSAGITVGAVALGVFIVFFGGSQAGLFPESMPNLHDAYDQYGFPYCFSSSVASHGISKPDQYDESVVFEVVQEIDDGEEPEISQYANIIMVQLESFFDINELTTVTCSENPVPNFQALKASCPSGYLTVPVVGAGTANTEFEAITQMSTHYFGTGEYPYNTIMQTNTCETTAYLLHELGYSTHAIHNNTGTFYDRNHVYANLGFDTFTSLEYMNDISYNALGWAKDACLIQQIRDALNSSVQKDYIYAVSVQGHGRYPREVIDENQRITVEGVSDPGMKCAYEYYVNQIAEMDAFIGELTSTLKHYSERIIVVFYGDHLPSLQIESEDLVSGDLMKTEYVIWTNYTLEAEDMDLAAYQLTSRVMELMGYHNGLLTKLHQGRDANDDYLHELELLQYDMLYGDMVCWDGVNPYLPTQLQMGVLPIEITRTSAVGQALFVTGRHFTPSSVAYINGEQVNTTFINSSTLLLLCDPLMEGNVVTVSQVSPKGIVLSTTDGYVVTEADLTPTDEIPTTAVSEDSPQDE